jgi:hypothetical protein
VVLVGVAIARPRGPLFAGLAMREISSSAASPWLAVAGGLAGQEGGVAYLRFGKFVYPAEDAVRLGIGSVPWEAARFKWLPSHGHKRKMVQPFCGMIANDLPCSNYAPTLEVGEVL